jgi:hypothetical protein
MRDSTVVQLLECPTSCISTCPMYLRPVHCYFSSLLFILYLTVMHNLFPRFCLSFVCCRSISPSLSLCMPYWSRPLSCLCPSLSPSPHSRAPQLAAFPSAPLPQPSFWQELATSHFYISLIFLTSILDSS